MTIDTMVSAQQRPALNKHKRICKFKGCNTILSMYNLNEYCLAHEIKAIEAEDEKIERLYTLVRKLRLRYFILKKNKKPLDSIRLRIKQTLTKIYNIKSYH